MTYDSHRPTSNIAKGKVILLGEHAVVYGHPALAGAIDRGVCTKIAERTQPEGSTSRLRVSEWKIDVGADSQHPVSLAFAAMLKAADLQYADVELRSDLPAAAGLGSSAALCVAIARSVAPDASHQTIATIANAGEACFHENPSGIDVALSMSGQIAEYRKESGLSPLDCPPLPLVVALSGIPRSTAKMVNLVRERIAKDTCASAAIEDIADLSAEGRDALLKSDWELLGSLMNQCQDKLGHLGVSIPTLERMIRIARKSGASGAKLTGAGGGGSIIALAPGREQKVMRALQEAGFESFITQVGQSELRD